MKQPPSVNEPQLEFLKADWPAHSKVQALTTTRHGGFSRADFQGLNLADHVGDDLQTVNQNRELLAEQLGITQPIWLQQVHGVTAVDSQQAKHHQLADAIYSNKANNVCAVLTADCLPLLFCNQSATKVAAAHAGWRGLADGIIESTVDLLQENPKNIMVWLGPAIGPQCFQVGTDVYDAFVKQNASAKSAFTQQDAHHYLADMYILARLRLQALGIENVYGGGLCTFSDEERFYSFRRNKTTGRMASLIWIAD